MMNTHLQSVLVTLTVAALVHCQPQPSEEGKLVVDDPAIVRGLEWLSHQADSSYGYKELTAKAVAALQLANTTAWYGQHNIFSILTVQQMKIQLLSQLAREEESALAANKLAEYSLAISSICEDARNVHGVDVIGLLTERQLALDWDLAVSSLAVCTAGAHVHKKQLRRLLDATRAHDSLTIDTLSMIMMALHCVVQEHRNRHLQHTLSAPTVALARAQKPDGSFGGFKTTAYAMQALQACDPAHRHWNYHMAVQFLTGFQQPDGSFRPDNEKDLEATILALLALGPRSLVNIKDMECQHALSQAYNSKHLSGLAQNGTSDGMNGLENYHENDHESSVTSSAMPAPPTPATASHSVSNVSDDGDVNAIANIYANSNASASIGNNVTPGKVVVSYTVWVHTNSSLARTMKITTDPGSNFYYVMQLAAQKDNFFAFEATEWPNGHYIHTLAGLKEEPMSYCYWLLYKLSGPPNMAAPPTNQFVAPLGVDELFVKNNDFYLFWYKKL